MISTRLLRALVPIAFAIGLAACAQPHSSGAPRPEALLSERTAPLDRRCGMASEPEALPPVDAVVDSAALDRALRGLGRAGAEARGYAVLSLSFDRNGWNSRREVVEHDLPAGLADSLQALVFAHRREVSPGTPWGARLRVDLGEAPRFRVGRQERCAARLREDPRLDRFSAIGSSRDPYASTGLLNTVWVRVLVDERGAIAEARLEHGGARMESVLLNYVRTLGFEPATVDGIPVASWARIPLRIGYR